MQFANPKERESPMRTRFFFPMFMLSAILAGASCHTTEQAVGHYRITVTSDDATRLSIPFQYAYIASNGMRSDSAHLVSAATPMKLEIDAPHFLFVATSHIPGGGVLRIEVRDAEQEKPEDGMARGLSVYAQGGYIGAQSTRSVGAF